MIEKHPKTTKKNDQKQSKFAPESPAAATHPGGRHQRIIHGWLAHGMPSGRQTSSPLNIASYVTITKPRKFDILSFCAIFAVFDEVLDFVDLSMEIFIHLLANSEFVGPRASH